MIKVKVLAGGGGLFKFFAGGGAYFCKISRPRGKGQGFNHVKKVPRSLPEGKCSHLGLMDVLPRFFVHLDND